MEKDDKPTPTMNMGKWTDEEHAMFVECVTKHGRNYVIIGDRIKTRSRAQIYTHVQGYFAKLEKAEKKKSAGKDVQMEDAKESGGKRKRVRKSKVEKQSKKVVMEVKAAEVDKGAPCQVSVDSHEAKATPTVANVTRVSLESTQPPSAYVHSPPPPAGLQLEASKTFSSKNNGLSALKVAKAETIKSSKASEMPVEQKAETTESSKAAEMQDEQPSPVKAFYQREDVQLLLSALAGALVVLVVRNLVL
jgi:hypothetical protein